MYWREIWLERASEKKDRVMSVAELLTELRKLDAHIVLGRRSAASQRTDRRAHRAASASSCSRANRRSWTSCALPSSSLRNSAPDPADRARQPHANICRGRAQRRRLLLPLHRRAPRQRPAFLWPATTGYDEGTEPSRAVGSLAKYFADQIRAFRAHGPMTIAGFCAGGTVAFELARQLKTNGAEVRNLVLFGSPYATAYRKLPRLIATTAYLAQRSIVHARALMSSGNRAQYLSDRLKVFKRRRHRRKILPRRSCPGATRAVEVATIDAVRGLHAAVLRRPPGSDAPLRGWKSSFDAPLRWQESCAHVSGVRRTG
jgi:thioesterase domain-containing protein